MAEMRTALKIFVGRPGGKRQIRRPRHRWSKEYNFNSRGVWTALIHLRTGTSGGLY
jgi:hypothetical protein